MSNKRITDLTELTTLTANDVFPVVDIETNITKKIKASNIIAPPSGVSGAIQFSNGSAFASDANNLFWDDINKRLGVGTNNPLYILDIQSLTGNSVLSITGNAATFISVKRFSNDAIRPRHELYKSRGTINAPLAVQTGDEIGSFDFNAYDGSANQRVGILLVTADSVSGSTITPQMAFGLGTSGPANQYRMVIKNDGNITIGNDLTTLGARLGIKGSGTTSATASLIVQNSGGNEALKVRDDRVIIMSGMPTSALGLPSGALWNDSGTIKIV